MNSFKFKKLGDIRERYKSDPINFQRYYLKNINLRNSTEKQLKIEEEVRIIFIVGI